MDIMMPEMDGQAAVRENRALEEAGGTLSITALDDVKNIVQSFKSVCDAYLFKPIDTGKLLVHVKELQLI